MLLLVLKIVLQTNKTVKLKEPKNKLRRNSAESAQWPSHM